MNAKTFRDLIVWQKAHELVLEIYKKTKSFPVEEKFGLVSQLRKSIASVPTNLVEGQKRKNRKEFLHFINIAHSSLEESRYHILLSKDLGYICKNDFDMLENHCEEISKMLSGLYKKLTIVNQ